MKVLVAIVSVPIVATIVAIIGIFLGIERLPKLARSIGRMRSEYYVGQRKESDPAKPADSK